MKRARRLLAACVFAQALGFSASAPAQPAALRAEVLDARALPTGPLDSAQALRELSGLDWDVARQRLVAVSDRGWLVEFTLDPRAQSLASLEPVLSMEVRVKAKPRANGESVVARPDGWWVADEGRWRVLDVARDGTVRSQMPLPGALGGDARAAPSAGAGVEALAVHARHGLIAVLQRPRPTDPQGTHLVQAEDGRHWTVAMSPGGRSTIKAADLRGDRLRLLEKIDPDVKGVPHLYVVHEIDLAADRSAPVRAWAIADARLAGHNLEGLACVDDRHCVLVSDSGSSKRQDVALFVLLRLP